MVDATSTAPIRLSFHELFVRAEGLGTRDGDYLDAEVRFDLTVDGATRSALHADVKLAAGSRFSDPLEVQWPGGLEARMPYGGYRDCVERYVRERVAAALEPKSESAGPGVTVRHLVVPGEATCAIEGPD